jgi:magnesium transporter
MVMAINVFVAATLGTLLPMGLTRINPDPALIIGLLLTTVLDCSFLARVRLFLRGILTIKH